MKQLIKIENNRHGKGKEYFDNGNIHFEGRYAYHTKKGKGKEYFKNVKVKFKGEYYNDEKDMEKEKNIIKWQPEI